MTCFPLLLVSDLVDNADTAEDVINCQVVLISPQTGYA